jgi:tetratricopeptide (TPR) repeat protein
MEENKMKKTTFLLTIFIFLMIVGCSNKEAINQNQDKQNDEEILQNDEEKLQQFNQLVELADSYYKEGRLDKSIATYKDSLELEDSITIRKQIDDIEMELMNVQNVKKFIDELYKIEKERLRSGIKVSNSDMEYIMRDLKSLIEGFEQIDTSQENEINKYIIRIKDGEYDYLHNYEYLKGEVNNKIYEDGGTTDLLSELDSSFAVRASATLALFRDWVLKSINNILDIPFPSRYNSVTN